MNRHLLLLIAVSLLLLSWFINFRHYLRTWIAQFRSKPSIAKRKRKKQESSESFSHQETRLSTASDYRIQSTPDICQLFQPYSTISG